MPIRNKVKLILLLVAVLSLMAGYFLRNVLSRRVADEAAILREIAPSDMFSAKAGFPPHYTSKYGIVAFNTYDVAPSIRGYAGPIKLLLALNPDGHITGIKILEHRETKNYIHYLETPGYLSRFIGKLVTDPFEVGQDIDGITRATVSVEALAKTVKTSSRAVATDILGMNIKADEKKAQYDVMGIAAALLFTVSFAAYRITRKTRKIPWLRDISLAAGILLFGILASSPFSILQIFNLVLLRPSSTFLWYVVVAGTLLSVALAGRFYCGWLCPFGALSEFIGRLPFVKWAVPAETDDAWRRLKYILFGIALAVVFLSWRVDYGSYEPYVTLFSLHGNVFTWSLVVIMLLANLKVRRFWCRYACPVAAFTGLLSLDSKGYPSSADCPMSNRPMPLISECIRCNRCYAPQKQEEV